MSGHRETTTKLNVALGDDDAGLQRLIGLVRRRGFAVTAMDAAMDKAGDMKVCMCVLGTRPIDVLIRQIESLIGVRTVSLEHAPAAAAVA